MKGVKLIIILHESGDAGREDKEVSEGARALASKSAGKAIILVNITGKVGLEPDIPELKGFANEPNITVGVYVIAHAYSVNWGNPSAGSTFPFITADGLCAYVASFLKKLDSPVLKKVCLLGCNIAAGSNPDDAVNGSYLQRFCERLGSIHNITPKVAGWDSYVSIYDDKNSTNYGRKKIKNDKGKSAVVTLEIREKHKFVYVYRQNSVAKLELAGWSDK